MLPATARTVPTMYLFLDSQDSEGASPALKTSVCSGFSPRTARGAAVLCSGTRPDGGVTGGLVRSIVGAVTTNAAAVLDSPGEALAAGVRNFPRHFFSSHSTQRTRPSETGNSQAWHLRRFLKTGGR